MYPIASEEKFADGEIIFKEGSSGDWVYVVLSGQVEIYKTINQRKYVIEVLGKGEVFGELSFLGNIKRTASAKAVGATTLGIIDRDYLYTEFNKLSSPMRSILLSVVMRFKKMLDRATGFSQRIEARRPRSIMLKYKDRDSFIKAYTGNIGMGGLFIKTNNPLKKGETFQMKLSLPDIKDPLNIRCEVVWSREKASEGGKEPAGMGVKFLEMSPKDRDVLSKYLKGS